MKILEFKKHHLAVIGDIHGEFGDFFNKIRQNVSNEKFPETIDEPTEFEKQLMNIQTEEEIQDEPHEPQPYGGDRPRIFGGLDNIELPNFSDTITSTRFKKAKHCPFDNTIVIVAGDCGFGFNKEQYYHDILNKYNNALKKSNTYVAFLRGNHDDPSYFKEDKFGLSNILFLDDYTVVITENDTTLCVGGAISSDRIWRKQEEYRINRYSQSKLKKLYWENEAVSYNEEELDRIISSKVAINSIISHSSPMEITRVGESWAKIDEKLLADIAEEKKSLENIANYLSQTQGKNSIKWWCHGHFHLGTAYNFSNEICGLIPIFSLNIFEYKTNMASHAQMIFHKYSSMQGKSKKAEEELIKGFQQFELKYDDNIEDPLDGPMDELEEFVPQEARGYAIEEDNEEPMF